MKQEVIIMQILSRNNQIIDEEIKARLSSYPNLLKDYYNVLVSKKSYNTARTYIKNITKFLDYKFGSIIPDRFYLEISSHDIDKYLNSLSSGSATNASKANIWSSLNSFFQFLIPRYISFNPVSRIKRPIVEKNNELVWLTDAETAKMLDHIIETANPQLQNRDVSILMLGLYCGMKASQIIECNATDVDLNANRIRIQEAQETNFFITLNEPVRLRLKKWLSDRSKMLSHRIEDALFISIQQHRISEDAIGDILRKCSVVLNKHVTSKTLRNTYVVNLLKKSKDINQCIKHLNLTNIPTTQQYIKSLITSVHTVSEPILTQARLLSPTSEKDTFSTDGLESDDSDIDFDFDSIDLSELSEICNIDNTGDKPAESEGIDTILRSLSKRQRCEMLRRILKEISVSNGFEYQENECTISDCKFGEGCSIYLEEVFSFERTIHQKITTGKHISFSNIYLDGRKLSPEDSIECLNLSAHSYYALYHAGIDSIGKLVKLTEKQIYELPCMTYSCATEIIGRLQLSGFCLKKKKTTRCSKKQLTSNDATHISSQNTQQELSYDMTIEELDFSVQTYNTIKRAGIHMVYELCEMTRSEILKLRHMRITNLLEIEEKLQTINLTIRPEDS